MYPVFTQIALAGTFLFFSCCQFKNDCRELAGHWTNHEGQVFQFETGGKALWVIQFGSKFDTFPIQYKYDCSTQPISLDLSGFQSGPLMGKMLFGIIEWTSDSSFRFDAESGISPDVRPTTFNAEQAEKYFKE